MSFRDFSLPTVQQDFAFAAYTLAEKVAIIGKT